MKHKGIIKFTFVIVFYLLGLLTHLKSDSHLSITHDWEFDTIAHRLLYNEELALKKYLGEDSVLKMDFKSKYQILDKLIRQAEQIIKIDRNSLGSQENALNILKAIDNILITNNFILFIHTKSLTKALSKKPLKDFGQQRFQLVKHRAEYVHQHQDEKFYRFDCDISSFIYLGIADVLGIPLYMVEVPSHNFVRWRFDAKKYINWDTNDAKSYLDDDYRTWKALEPFNRDTEIISNYLKDMSHEQVFGYHYSLIAGLLSKNGFPRGAEEYFLKSIETYPFSPTAINNLAWLYVTNADFNEKEYALKALELAKQAVKRSPGDIEFRDTLACAYAAVGDFKNAIIEEKGAYNKDGKVKGFEECKTCLDMGLK